MQAGQLISKHLHMHAGVWSRGTANLLGCILSSGCCFCSDVVGALRRGCFQVGNLLLQAPPVMLHADQPVCQLLATSDQLPLESSQLLQGGPADPDASWSVAPGWARRQGVLLGRAGGGGGVGHSLQG